MPPLDPIEYRIAIDGRPASPAMAAALAEIDRNARAANARKALIAADPRIIRLRALRQRREYAEGMAGGLQLFADMASGRLARLGRISALQRARIQQLDGFHNWARKHLAEAAAYRRQHYEVTVLQNDFVSIAEPTSNAVLGEVA